MKKQNAGDSPLTDDGASAWASRRYAAGEDARIAPQLVATSAMAVTTASTYLQCPRILLLSHPDGHRG